MLRKRCLILFTPIHKQSVVIRNICFELWLYISSLFFCFFSLFCVLRELLVFSTLLLGGLTSEKLAGSRQMKEQHQMLSGSENAHEKKRWIWNVKMFALWNAQILTCKSLHLYVSSRGCPTNAHSCSNFIRQWNIFIFYSVLAVWKRQCRCLVIWWLNLMNIIQWIIPVDWLESLISLPKSSVTFLAFFLQGCFKTQFSPLFQLLIQIIFL